MVKIFMRRGCGSGVNRQGVLDSGWHVADRAQVERGAEELNVVLTLAVVFFVIMLLKLGQRCPRQLFLEQDQMGRHWKQPTRLQIWKGESPFSVNYLYSDG
jgi:hypothetical protein